MEAQAERTKRFRDLHVPGDPLLMPNPWDVGSALLLVSLGFRALATTSLGHAATLGRLDGGVSRDEALAHAVSIVEAVDVPVSADLEDGFGASPDAVAQTVAGAGGVGLAGCSIEDHPGTPDASSYAIGLAAERVAAAVEAARGAGGLVLTARAENYVRGNPDLPDTIARLQAYQEAGADVLYAPRVTDLSEVRSIIESVDRPVNVLVRAGMPPVSELAAAGAARLSVGGAFTLVALGALERAARELRDEGTYAFFDVATDGARATAEAFRSRPRGQAGADAGET